MLTCRIRYLKKEGKTLEKLSHAQWPLGLKSMKGETRLHQGRLSVREEASTLIGSAVFSDGLKDSPIVELIGKQSLEESRQKPQEGDECGTSQQAEGPLLGSIVS